MSNLETRLGKDGYSYNGLTFERIYTKPGVNPLDEIEYEKRISVVYDREDSTKNTFYMEDVEVPKFWSQTATDILAEKYFRKAGVPGTGTEKSSRQVVDRISSHIRRWGEQHDYFASEEDANTFQEELSYLLINQYAAFNSPVWFNVGLSHKYGIVGDKPSGNWIYDDKVGDVVPAHDVYSRPQGSACFIQSVEDDLGNMMNLVKSESRIFKYGSGTGTNFSPIRAIGENLSGGGVSSGLMSWLKVYDVNAGATKSGGTTRRAAKMVILNHNHPEIKEFVHWKARGEELAGILIAAGINSDFEGEAYQTVSGQNSNNSVRVTDEFMQGIDKEDSYFETINRTNGKVRERIRNKDLMDMVAKAAWRSADPGMQFHDNVNKWNPCINTAEINASNPCSEYMFLDDSACNLASTNLLKFLGKNGKFDVDGFKHANRIIMTAQDILVGLSSYPTEKIARNSEDFRPIGLGYANLGALAMVMGIPYDSKEAQTLGGAITSIMTGEAYHQSAKIAGTRIGPFNRFKENKEPFLKVMDMHRTAVEGIPISEGLEYLIEEARNVWSDAVNLGGKNGYRNAQASVLAPTGTIGLLMDCDTTGIEPDYALVKGKKLAGGGFRKIINQSVPRALKNLGYNNSQIAEIISHITGHGKDNLINVPNIKPEHIEKLKNTDNLYGNLDMLGYSKDEIKKIKAFIEGHNSIEGAPYVKKEHYAVFDTANRSPYGTRFIEPMGHIRMMAAAQPFISGAISKTVNLPNEATVEDIKNIYVEGWKHGLKAIAVYRDGSKMSQPLNVGIEEKIKGKVLEWGEKRYRPLMREAQTYELNIGGQKLHMTVGEDMDGNPIEVFLNIFKEGSAYKGVVSSLSVAISNGLQTGWKLEDMIKTYVGARFEPDGLVSGYDYIKRADSIPDLVFRILGIEYKNRFDLVSGDLQVDVNKLRSSVIKRRKEDAKLRQLIEDNEEVRVLLEKNGFVKSKSYKGEGRIEEITVKKPIVLRGNNPNPDISSGMICSRDGGMMIKSGSCHVCLSCGDTSGCS